jgi:autotransporter-associated beta strand protein
VGSFNGNVVLNDHLLVDHNGSGLLSIVRPVTGAFGIVKQGSGTISFGGSQTFSGGLTLNAGGLEFASSSALGTGTFTVNGGAFGATGLSNRTLANPIVFNANVTLSGSNVRTATYTGAVDLGNATRTLTVSQTTNINGTISNGGLTVAGNGSFTLTLGGSNDFTGPTTVTSGTLVLNNANALAGSTFGGGAGSLSFGTLTSATFGGMSGSTNLALQNASSAAVALSVGANGGSTSFSAALSGAGSLVKVGSGTFTFAGTTANGVPTSVSAGKFVANGILGTGSLSVAAAAWLAGTGTVGGAVMVDGILSPGASPGMLTLGSLDLGSTSTTIMELAGTTRGSLYDSIDITAGGIGYGGTLQLDFQQTFADNTSFVLFGILTGTGSRTGSFASVTAVGSYGTLTFTNDGSGVWSSGPTGITDQEIRFAQSTGEVIVVPEPSTTAVIAAGISIAWLCRRRRPRGRPLAGLDGPCCW